MTQERRNHVDECKVSRNSVSR